VKNTQDVKLSGHIAQQLRYLRGLESQAVFAKKLGISRDLLANYETGRTVPSDQRLEKFRQALGLSSAAFDESDVSQPMVFFGLARGFEFRASPDELAFARLLRVVSNNTVLAVATSLLDAVSSGLVLTDEKDGEQLKEALERVVAIFRNGGKYDKSPAEKSGADALRQAQELARQAIGRRP